ncbi:hypothetical protein CMT41_01645 [Colwellia sp. MT41]|nr:hypothetical protein CMT41_01645 [Colwellia sp. MT41]
MYVNAVNTVYFNKFKVTRDYVFTVYIDGEELNVGSESLIAMGYRIFYKSDCLLELRSDKHSNYVYCSQLDQMRLLTKGLIPVLCK